MTDNIILEKFIKEITQNIGDETGLDVVFIAEIINLWEKYKERYFENETNS